MRELGASYIWKQRHRMFLFQCLYEKSFAGCCNSIFQLTYSLKSDAPYCLNIPKLKSILMQFLYDQMHSLLSAFAFAAFFVVLVFCHLYVFGLRGITHLSDSRSFFSRLLVWGTLRFHWLGYCSQKQQPSCLPVGQSSASFNIAQK